MTDDQDGHALQEGDPNELRKHIQGLFGNQLKSLAIETTEHGLILHGACDSFYTKQLVQEVVRKHSRQRIVLNALVVDEPKTKPASEDHFERGFIASQPTLLPDYEHGQEPHRREKNALHHKANTMHELSRNTEQEPSLPESAQDQDSQLKVDVTPRSFTTIFHPSDFSEPSKVAFAHALKLALDAKAMLQMMHVDKHGMATWEDFPSVRETLIRWKVLPEGSSRDEVEKLGITVNKLIASSADPVKACIDYFEVHDVDLIVLSVHQRDGVMRWLENMVGERISQGSKQNTLFIPVGQLGFVSQVDGTVTLDHILIPVVKKPRGEAAVRFVQNLISSLNLPSGKVTLLHVGPSDTMPFVQHPLNSGWTWNRVRLEGERTEAIVKYAKETDAKLVVMTTDGPDRFLDGLRGTTSERILRKIHCPVAVVPVESVAE